MNISDFDWGTITGFIVIAGFLWRLTHNLNRDMRSLENRVTKEIHGLGERLANIEGKIEAVLFQPPPGVERKR